MVDIIKVIKDYARVMGFSYWIDPEERAWIEVYHPNGGSRAHSDGRVESSFNPKPKAVMKRKIVDARTIEVCLAEPEDGQEAWHTINRLVDELTDYQLTRLIEAIRRLQVARKSEKIATTSEMI